MYSKYFGVEMKPTNFKVGDRVISLYPFYTGTVVGVSLNSIFVARDDGREGSGDTYKGKETWKCNKEAGRVLNGYNHDSLYLFGFKEIIKRMVEE